MLSPDALDTETVEAIAGSVTALIIAAHEGDRLRMVATLNQLLAAVTELRKARPSDQALHRAIARLG